MISRGSELGGDQIAFLFTYIDLTTTIQAGKNTALLVVCRIKGVCFQGKVLFLNSFNYYSRKNRYVAFGKRRIVIHVHCLFVSNPWNAKIPQNWNGGLSIHPGAKAMGGMAPTRFLKQSTLCKIRLSHIKCIAMQL